MLAYCVKNQIIWEHVAIGTFLGVTRRIIQHKVVNTLVVNIQLYRGVFFNG